MKELLKDLWRLSLEGRPKVEALETKYGQEVERAQREGLIEVEGQKASLTTSGRGRIEVVLAGGVFDILHPGHIFFLSRAKEEGDLLAVVVASDQTVEKRKRIPIVPGRQRLEMVRSLKPVDVALLGGRGDIFDTLEKVRPDVVALGPDQGHRIREVEDKAKERGLKVRVVRVEEYKETELSSTKSILQRIVDRRFPLTPRRREEK